MKLLRFKLPLNIIIINFILSSFASAQTYESKSSLYVTFEKMYIEKNELYNLQGPASFYPTTSNGFRFCLGYSITFKKSNQISFQGGFGQHNYGFGLDIKPYQYPEIRDASYSSDYISAVHNGSIGISYTKRIWNKKRCAFSLTGGFDVYVQGHYDTLRYFATRNWHYYSSPPVNPDTVYYDYRITNLMGNKLHLTPTINIKAEFSYLIGIRHRFSVGIGYRYALSDFVSGYYVMFPTTVSSSSGKWKLRGNSINLSVGYNYLLFKNSKTKTDKQ